MIVDRPNNCHPCANSIYGKYVRLWLFVILAVGLLSGCGRDKVELVKRFDARQLLVVTTPGWDATEGVLVAYEWQGMWRRALEPIPVQIGRTGTAWGAGMHDPKFNRPPLKQEGDGKSPAGIFPLESLFGYEDLSAKMDYLKVDANTFCVDDPKSKYYNQIVQGDQVVKDWDSAETMRMESDAYKYGIVVGYNTRPTEPNGGSCIFYHIGSPGGTTAGCTAMSEAQILKLITFLDKSQNPIIVQAPQAQYQQLAAAYDLP